MIFEGTLRPSDERELRTSLSVAAYSFVFDSYAVACGDRVRRGDLGCGADFAEMVLAVTGPGSASRTFNSSFYGRCPERMIAATFIAYTALARLDAVLATTISTCAGDGGLHCTSYDAGVDGG
ncbi:MAG: hypothetical protein U0326_33195 [Polyangiales bacterium]